jgi:hypothetical protein
MTPLHKTFDPRIDPAPRRHFRGRCFTSMYMPSCVYCDSTLKFGPIAILGAYAFLIFCHRLRMHKIRVLQPVCAAAQLFQCVNCRELGDSFRGIGQTTEPALGLPVVTLLSLFLHHHRHRKPGCVPMLNFSLSGSHTQSRIATVRVSILQCTLHALYNPTRPTHKLYTIS